MSIFSSNKENREPNPAVSYAPPVSHTPSSHSMSSSHSTATNISEGATVEGQIKIEGDIRIDGHIKGGITSKGKVTIGGSGKVDGDIICQNAEIGGLVMGKLKIADILYLKGNAVIDGDINTGKLVIENGVRFNGNCSMGNAAPSTLMPKPEAAPSNKVELSA